MAEDHGAQEAGQLSRAWTKERAAQRVRNWTVQNEMKSVLGPVSAGVAGGIVDSANSKERRA